MANISAQPITVAETGDQQKVSYTPALISLAVLYFMMGFITCLNDTLVPFFKDGFVLSYSQSSLVQFYFFLTYGVMSIPAGKIVEKVGFKNGMVMGFSIAALGALLFFPAAILHTYEIFLASLFILAIGIVLLQVAANPYITILGSPKTASSRLTLIQGVGSIGTTVAPLFGAYFILGNIEQSNSSSDAVKYPYLGIAALLIVISVIVSRLRLPVIKVKPVEDVQADVKRRSIFSFRNLKFGIWAIFCYVGAEVAIGTFLTNYIADTIQISEKDANSYVSFYWGSMLVGRLIGAFVLKSIRASSVLAFCASLAILLIGFSIYSTGHVAVWSMIAVGLCNSIMFAIIFSLSVEGLGQYTTRASGILSTAIAGGAIISYSQGLLIDNFNWQVAFMLPVACYLYILFFGLNGYQQKVLATATFNSKGISDS